MFEEREREREEDFVECGFGFAKYHPHLAPLRHLRHNPAEGKHCQSSILQLLG